MKTLIEYIKRDADLPLIRNGLELGRWDIPQVIDKTSGYWQRELLQSEWYKANQKDIALMLETVETNKRDAAQFLKGET
tara:strand:+ start:416 stop:652 length:237 start_codon:yes stop_codon:yes gene_type:complete